MRIAINALSLVVLVLLPSVAAADAPGLIPLQGVLTDPEGYPIMGQADVIFALYPSNSAEMALWTESQELTLQDGTFTAYLGEKTELSLDIFQENDEVWLGVTVEDDPEMSRVLLGSAPYAAFAQYCGSVPAHTHEFSELTGSIPTEQLPPGIAQGVQNCEVGQVVVGIDQDGSLVCAEDADTTYGPTDFAASDQGCDDGESVVGISPMGFVQCQAKAATSYSGEDFALSSQSCPGSQKVTGISPVGELQCAEETTYSGADFVTSGQVCKDGYMVTAVSNSGKLQCDYVTGSQIPDKVMLYIQNAACGANAIPTTEPSCTTGQCSGGFWNGHFDCSGVCLPMQPASTCDNTPLGYLIQP